MDCRASTEVGRLWVSWMSQVHRLLKPRNSRKADRRVDRRDYAADDGEPVLLADAGQHVHHLLLQQLVGRSVRRRPPQPTGPPEPEGPGVRLNRYIAQAGVTSRRKADELIAALEAITGSKKKKENAA